MQTNRRIINGAIAFFGVCATSATTFWLAGYDFDTRSPDVAIGFILTVMFAAIAGVLGICAKPDC